MARQEEEIESGGDSSACCYWQCLPRDLQWNILCLIFVSDFKAVARFGFMSRNCYKLVEDLAYSRLCVDCGACACSGDIYNHEEHKKAKFGGDGDVSWTRRWAARCGLLPPNPNLCVEIPTQTSDSWEDTIIITQSSSSSTPTARDEQQQQQRGKQQHQPGTDDFAKLGLRESLLCGIKEFGMKNLSSLQQHTIPLFVQRNHGILIHGSSGRGTGKSTSYVIGLLQHIDAAKQQCQALVLVPTHVHAPGIAWMIETIGKKIGITCATCCCSNNHYCEDACYHATHIVVGTPHSILEAINQEKLLLDQVRQWVLDDTDRIIVEQKTTTGGGEPAITQEYIYKIFQKLSLRHNNDNVHVGIITSTLGPEVLQLASNLLLRHPVTIVREFRRELTLDCVDQYYLQIEQEEQEQEEDEQRCKLEVLCDLLDNLPLLDLKVIVYVNTRRKVEWLSESIIAAVATSITDDNDDGGFTCFVDHKEYFERKAAGGIQDDKGSVSSSLQILVTKDCVDPASFSNDSGCGRGRGRIWIINFDIPVNRDIYIQRIGRRGRLDPSRTVVSFVSSNNDIQFLQDIEQFYMTSIQEMPLDTNIVDLL